MTHRLRLLTALSAVLFGALGAYQIHQSQVGEAALEEAEALLQTPFSEVSELAELPIAGAADALRRARETGVQVPRALSSEIEAFEYWLAGDLIFAEGALGEARQGDRFTVRRQVLAAAIERAAGRDQEAWTRISEAVAEAPNDARALLMMTDVALDRGDARAALTAVRHLAADHASLASVQNRLGLALEGMGQEDDAERAFSRAIEIDESLHVAWINLGRAHRRRGDALAAASAFERALALEPGDADGWLGRGLVALDAGDYELAEERLQRASELSPHNDAALLSLGDLAVGRGELPRAIEHYRRAIGRDATNAASFVKLGNALVRTRAFADALRAFEEAVDLDEDLAAARNGLGSALASLGRNAEAQVALRRAAALDEGDPHPLMNLAMIQARLGQRDAALASWTAARARDSSVAEMPRQP